MEVTGGCKSSTCAFHGNIWGSGSIAPVILKISTIWEQEYEGISNNSNNNHTNIFLIY
jgi:hypothetical protein